MLFSFKRSLVPLASFFLAAFLLTSSTFAENLIVEMIDGTIHKGEKVKDADKVLIINITGQKIPLQKKLIKNVTIAKTPEEIYIEKRLDIKDDDFNARMSLAYSMNDIKAYAIAKRELDAILKDKPGHGPAKRLLKVINTRLAMQQHKAAQATKTAKNKPETAEKPKPNSRSKNQIERSQLISDEDMNLIRLWELPADLDAYKPRIKIPRENIDKLFEKYNAEEAVPKGKRERSRFYGKKGYKQIDLFFELGARELYRGIEIFDDPPAFKYWRQKLNASYASKYFKKYFNNTTIPGLILFDRRPHDELEAYSNFFILTQLERDGMPLINRADPEKSILFQWGLPRDVAEYPAPKVTGWRPFFRGKEDQRFIDAIYWIKGLYQELPVPDYGVKYSPHSPASPKPTPNNN
ncbi:hypothetical protein KS4_17160 [Poriferisphaera corsica]|uniref:Uncharacterized protein n=1 Tax=Poriferisphaera corsica TaxID=2528020 RepID=A0A517YTU5_9BACT|nr:hypothetical protein [Poriferisphaera corsica]QDU33660.1 hypothetical protein KS4_17160 [Poriferisphaera corsica]